MTVTAFRMFNSLMMLAFEAIDVVALRTLTLMRGGTGALQEAELMVREKIDAALEMTLSLMAGASAIQIGTVNFTKSTIGFRFGAGAVFEDEGTMEPYANNDGSFTYGDIVQAGTPQTVDAPTMLAACESKQVEIGVVAAQAETEAVLALR